MQVSIINALKSSSRIEAVFSFVETTATPDHLPLCSYLTITCRSMGAVCAWPAVHSLTYSCQEPQGRSWFYYSTVHRSRWGSGRLRKLFRVVTERGILSLSLELKLCLLHFITKVPPNTPTPILLTPAKSPWTCFSHDRYNNNSRIQGLFFGKIKKKAHILQKYFKWPWICKPHRPRGVMLRPGALSNLTAPGEALWSCPPHPALPWGFWNSSSGFPHLSPSLPELHHLSPHPKPALVSFASVSSLCRHPSESQREGSVKVGDGQGGGLGGPAL